MSDASVLVRAPHLWQVGLDDPEGRSCWTTVVPVEADFAVLIDAVAAEMPDGMRWVPPQGYAHFTLEAAETPTLRLQVLRDVQPLRWRATGVDVTRYSVRLSVQAVGWDELCAAVGVTERSPYSILGYAIAEVELPPAAELESLVLPRLPAGISDRVEQHVFDECCKPFAPRVPRSMRLGSRAPWPG